MWPRQRTLSFIVLSIRLPELVSSEEGLSLSRPLLARHCLRVQGWATSRNPGSQQGSWFPASLTGKTFEDQELSCPCCPDRTCSTAERRSTRLVPRPVADGRRR